MFSTVQTYVEAKGQDLPPCLRARDNDTDQVHWDKWKILQLWRQEKAGIDRESVVPKSG
jgi:hypothetical protein